MNCPDCQKEARRFGRDRKGNQRFQCARCKKTFTAPRVKPLDDMRLAMDKALLVLKLLVEGNSIRSTERITGVEKKTILSLLHLAGEKCERLLEEKIHGLSVRDVQADEIWAYVEMKEKTKSKAGIEDSSIGDAYCFVAMERHTKLVLAWHLGRRTMNDTIAFTEKLREATTGNFQVTTDGFKPYEHAVVLSLGAQRVDFAMLIKIFSGPGVEDQRKYSPAECIDSQVVPIYGNPDLERVCTSHVERQNLTLRMSMRRLTRLTNAFSKKWANLKAAYALQFAYYNFCRVHQTLRITPAMEAGITNHIWTLRELLEIR